MKICILTHIYGNPPPEYCAITKKINAKYALKHGYDFKISNVVEKYRPPHYGWIRTALELVNSYDYLLYLDADAWFVNHEQRIESLFQYMRPKTLLLFNPRRFDSHPNSGVCLMKRSEQTHRILAGWYRIPLDDKECINGGESIQLAIRKHLYRKHWKYIDVAPRHSFNSEEGKYIRHLPNYLEPDKNRIINAYANDPSNVS